MKLKRKQKGVLSLVMTFAMVFSAVGNAAGAEPMEPYPQSVTAADTEPEPGPVMTEEETTEETKEKAEPETEETEEETEPETEETEPETKDEDNQEEENEPETKDTWEDVNEDETEGAADEETKPETEDGWEDETEDIADEETKLETEEETKEDFTSDVHEHNWSEDWVYDGTCHWHGCQEEDCPVTEDREKAGYGEHTYDEYSVCTVCGFDAPDVHEHSWSEDWTYDGTCHWRQCQEKGCPVTDDRGKDGYGEHTYDEYGVCMICGFDAMAGIAVASADDLSYQGVYDTMIGLKDVYPEGMKWTNYEPYGSNGNLGSAYTWHGGAIDGAGSAVGCMAFAFILSDAAFDYLPARKITNFTFDDVRVGDILRVNGNSHSVIVLKKSNSGIVVAEGNYNSSVHWGRVMPLAEVMDASFIITRYPVGYVAPDDSDADTIVDGGTENNVNWSLTKQGILTISGSGAVPSYPSGSSSPWSSYSDQILTVNIENGVTGIGDYAFSQSALMAVTIPGSVKTIGNNAFYKCEALISATVSEGVTTIGDNAFRGCTALTHIDFPASIISVGAGAFLGCREMVSVRFKPGSHPAVLGDGMFAQCQKLTTVTLPQTADNISGSMFQSCKTLPELYIPASVKAIGMDAFTSSGIKIIYFGGSEEEWNAIEKADPSFNLKLNAEIIFNAEFKDPFATDPNDPGDFHPGESDGGGTDSDGSGSNNNDSSNGGSTSGSTGSSNVGPISSSSDSSSDNSGSSSETGSSRIEDPNPVVSTTIRRGEDGSTVITKTQKDGTVATIMTDASGKVETEVKLSALAVNHAGQSGKAIVLPISAVSAAGDGAGAPTITIDMNTEKPVKVAIPTVAPTAGTVAVLVHEDGSTEVIKNSVPTEKNIVASLSQKATIKIVDNTRTFSDVPAEAWFREAAVFVAARDLFYCTTETAFAPGEPMTYATLMTALARFDGVNTDGGAVWYEKSMEWAAVHGMNDGTNPGRTITGEQLVIMLWKYAGSPAVNTLSDDAKANQVSERQEAVLWAAENGIVSGFEGEGSLDLQKLLNRGEAAQMMMNFAKKLALNSMEQ